MNRITRRFADLKEQKKVAFIPFIMAGDPTLEATTRLVVELEKAGADIIELGVPFSDPVADGVVNQEAAQRALIKDTSLHDVVALVKSLRKKSHVPIVLFTYCNPILAYGYQVFARDAGEAGVDGVLCVDLPPEEAADLKKLLDQREIASIYLVAPTTSPERLPLIAQKASGFIYYVSRTGVTGEQANLEAAVQDGVNAIKQHTEIPVAVGFGISTPEQAAEVAKFADGVVVGSAIVRMVGKLGADKEMPKQVAAFGKALAEAIKLSS